MVPQAIQRFSEIAARLRLANITAELRPLMSMIGHKKVQTMAHNKRLPSVGAS
jgi:hypothetical protein